MDVSLDYLHSLKLTASSPLKIIHFHSARLPLSNDRSLQRLEVRGVPKKSRGIVGDENLQRSLFEK